MYIDNVNRGLFMNDSVMSSKAGPFVNFSNHPSNTWTDQQLDAAIQYGRIIDLPFPSVDPYMSEATVQKLAEKIVEEILEFKPSAVMCQGEFGLSFSVTRRLLAAGIPVLYACSERKVHVKGNIKTVQFDFVQFRRFE